MVSGSDVLSQLAGAYSFVAQNDWLSALVILVSSFFGAKVLYFVLEQYVSKLTRATKTTLDDELLQSVKGPVYLVSLVVGFYFSLLQIGILTPYAGSVRKGFVVVMIGVGTYTAARVTVTLLNWYAVNLAAKTETKVDEHFMPVIRKVVSVFIYAVGLVVILDQLGIKVTALVASLGVASLAVALALQETLSNFFAGLYVMADKPAVPGDFVKLETGDEGFVEEIGWRSTKIRLLNENIVIIPNAKLAQGVLTNYHRPFKGAVVVIDCGVSYDSDLEKVEKVTIKIAREVLKRCEAGDKDFEPVIRFKAFGESNINFAIVLKVKDYAVRAPVIHEFIKAIMKEYSKEGIEISWPVRKVYLKKSER
ncbi:mechanosensitive ion channel family protein [Candidatus Woesearchaeota archaeon]|nr:mechanosensitive ion channel family protein [Candidatus Woesearchaeota archaeon]